MTAYGQSDVEFYGEFYGAQDVTGFYWVQKLYMKNLEKVEKIMNIQEYPTKFEHFSTLLNVCFHMDRSKLKYLNREKTSKNPRISAYLYNILYKREHQQTREFAYSIISKTKLSK